MARAGGDTPIPLVEFSKIAVKIIDDGGFRVKFDIPYWAYQRNIDLRRGMVRMVNESFAGSSIWQIRSADNLLFYSSIKHSVFKSTQKITAAEKTKMGVPAHDTCLVNEKCYAIMLEAENAREKEDFRELVADTQSVMSNLVDTIWEILEGKRDIPDKMIFKGLLKGMDLVFQAGTIYIRIKEGESEEDIIVGDLSELIAGWLLSIGVIKTVSKLSKASPHGLIAGLFASAIFAFSGGDELVAKYSLKVYLEGKLSVARKIAKWRRLSLKRFHYFARLRSGQDIVTVIE